MQQKGKFTITSQDPQDWRFRTRKYQLSFALHATIILILLSFTASQCSLFNIFPGLMGLCNIKNPKFDGFNICEKKIFLSFDMDLTNFPVMWFDIPLVMSVL